MLWVPNKGVLRVENNVGSVAPAGIPGTSVTTGGVSGTKGAVSQLIASTLFDAYYVRIMAAGYNLAANASEGALDIMIGAATEEVIIADLLMGHCGGDVTGAAGAMKIWEFPLYIPAGSRLSAKACGVRISTAFGVMIYLYGGTVVPNFRVGGKVTTYGVTGNRGITITPGNAAEGAYAQIVASTTIDHFAIMPSFQVATDTTVTVHTLSVDVGLGAATEEEIGQAYWYQTDANEKMYGPQPSIPIYQDIPAGSRLTMRASCNGAPDGSYDGALHCVS